MAIPDFHTWLNKLLQGDLSAQSLWNQYIELKSFNKDEERELIGLFDKIIELKREPYTQVCYLRATFHMYAIGGENHIEALKLFQIAIERNHTDAMIQCGLLYLYGLGVAQDDRHAESLFKKALELGNDEALYQLAYLYLHGGDATKDIEKASKMYEEALAKNNRNALVNMARIKQQQGNIGEAVTLLEKAAENGSIEALRNLGYIYLYCKHDKFSKHEFIQKNYSQAIEYFDKAIKFNDSAAMIERAYMHRFGHGCPRNLNSARKLYEDAVTFGNLHACGYLADMDYCENKTRIEKIINLLEKALSVDNSDAMVLRAKIHLEQDPPEKDQAIALLERAIEFKNPQACYLRAEMLFRGEYEPRNLLKARQLYLQFAEIRQEKMSFDIFALDIMNNNTSLQNLKEAFIPIVKRLPENEEYITSLLTIKLKEMIIDIIHTGNVDKFSQELSQKMKPLFTDHLFTHRQIWKPVMINLGIALTGIGLLLLIIRVAHELLCAPKQAINTPSSHRIFFFAKTRTEMLAEEVFNCLNQVDFSEFLDEKSPADEATLLASPAVA